MPKGFTLDEFRGEVNSEKAINRIAKEGWDYLIERGIPEEAIFKPVRLPFSGELEVLLTEYQSTRLEARKVRALGEQLIKCASRLEEVTLKCPDIEPISSQLGGTMKAVGVRLKLYHPKASKGRRATGVKGRIHSDPVAVAAVNLVRLYEVAAAGFHRPEWTATVTRQNAGAAPSTLGPLPKKMFAWACALLEVAGDLAGHPVNLSPDLLRKLFKERFKLPSSEPA